MRGIYLIIVGPVVPPGIYRSLPNIKLGPVEGHQLVVILPVVENVVRELHSG